MKTYNTGMEGVIIIQPEVHEDKRGYFYESFSAEEFSEKVRPTEFVMDCESFSRLGVVRGLHYQLPPFAQSKLVRAARGKILDVAVDVRLGSPTFGKHVAVELSEQNRRQLFIPRGFAHGFSVLSPEAVVQYKCDNYYSPAHERSIFHGDPALGIDWGVDPGCRILSDKDKEARAFGDAQYFDCHSPLY